MPPWLQLLLLVAAMALLLLVPRLMDPHPYSPRKAPRFDLQAARRGESYGVCDPALVDRLRAEVGAQRRDDALRARTRSGAVFCGTQRTLLFRAKVPWSGCFEALPSAKARLLDEVGRLCDDQRRAVESAAGGGVQAPTTRGVVFTGLERHLGLIFRAVLGLRAVNCSLPAEVFVDPDLLPLCEARLAKRLRGVRCRALPGRTVGYVAKFHALLLSSFSEVIFANAGVLFARNPEELLLSAAFRDSGAVLFPDDWGERCRLEAVSGNAAAAQFGQSAWSTHILFQAGVGGLSWRPERVYAQEAETSVVAIDTSRHSAVLALAVFMKDDWDFFAHVFHGDKDIFRLAFLIMQRPFHFSPHLPGTSLVGGGVKAIVHFFGNSSLPFFFSLRGSLDPEAFRNVYRLRPEFDSAASACSLDKSERLYRPLTAAEDGYDGNLWVKHFGGLNSLTDARWSLGGK